MSQLLLSKEKKENVQFVMSLLIYTVLIVARITYGYVLTTGETIK
jgi:hypothetical protein